MARAAKKKVASKKQRRGKKTARTGRSSSDVPVKTAAAESEKTQAAPARWGDLERVVDELWRRSRLPLGRWEWPRWGELTGLLEQQAPLVDIVDREKEVLVRAEVPGVDKDDLDVSIVERMLTIKGSSRKEEKEEKDDYLRHEIRSGTFSRSVLLPADVNAAKAQATFKDGVLQLRLPKVRASKRRQIPLE